MLEADDLHLISWSIDGASGVYQDMKSHTGGSMTLGKGTIYGTSCKQLFKTWSSSEAELVAIDEIVWHRSCGPATFWKPKDI